MRKSSMLYGHVVSGIGKSGGLCEKENRAWVDCRACTDFVRVRTDIGK